MPSSRLTLLLASKHLCYLGVAANGAGRAGQAGWRKVTSSRRAMGRSAWCARELWDLWEWPRAGLVLGSAGDMSSVGRVLHSWLQPLQGREAATCPWTHLGWAEELCTGTACPDQVQPVCICAVVKADAIEDELAPPQWGTAD